MADQVVEVGGVEPHDARWRCRLNAGDRRRAEQQRHLAEIRARLVSVDARVPSGQRLEDGELSLEKREERGRLAFDQQPFAGAESYVGRARCKGLAFALRQAGEERDLREQLAGDHALSPAAVSAAMTSPVERTRPSRTKMFFTAKACAAASKLAIASSANTIAYPRS